MRLRLAWKLLLLLAVAIVLLGWHLARQPGDGLLHVTFLDVGQADSCVIQSPSGKVLLIDTGGVGQQGAGQEETEQTGDDAGRRIVAPFLQRQGIGHIDAILLTHPHADHIGGAASLLRRFAVGMLLDNGEPTGSPLVAHYLETARAQHVLYRAVRRGKSLDCGDGVVLDVLAPTDAEAQLPAESNGAANNASLVMRLRYGRTAFLLTGDAEMAEETELAQSGLPLDCDVLKAGHHGSRTSTSPLFLNRAHPQNAVISVGAHNLYGHPSGDVLTRLRDSHVRVFRTDLVGAVLCTSDGSVVRTQTMSLHSAPNTP